MAYFAASTDDVETNTKFAQSLELDYPILSDPEAQTAGAYGVLMGNGKLAARQTVYIGADGKLLLIDREVSPRSAGQDMVAQLEKLGIPKR